MGQSVRLPEITTVKQVAHYLQVSRNTVYKCIKATKIPGVIVGYKLRFVRAKFLDALKQGFPETKKAGRPKPVEDT